MVPRPSWENGMQAQNRPLPGAGVSILHLSYWCPQAESSPTEAPRYTGTTALGMSPFPGGGRRDPGRGTPGFQPPAQCRSHEDYLNQGSNYCGQS